MPLYTTPGVSTGGGGSAALIVETLLGVELGIDCTVDTSGCSLLWSTGHCSGRQAQRESFSLEDTQLTPQEASNKIFEGLDVTVSLDYRCIHLRNGNGIRVWSS